MLNHFLQKRYPRFVLRAMACHYTSLAVARLLFLLLVVQVLALQNSSPGISNMLVNIKAFAIAHRQEIASRSRSHYTDGRHNDARWILANISAGDRAGGHRSPKLVRDGEFELHCLPLPSKTTNIRLSYITLLNSWSSIAHLRDRYLLDQWKRFSCIFPLN